jgi:hypothetical protein
MHRACSSSVGGTGSAQEPATSMRQQYAGRAWSPQECSWLMLRNLLLLCPAGVDSAGAAVVPGVCNSHAAADAVC